MLWASTKVIHDIDQMFAVILKKFKPLNYLLFHFFSFELPHCFFLLMIFVLRISLVNKEKVLRRLNAEMWWYEYVLFITLGNWIISISLTMDRDKGNSNVVTKGLVRRHIHKQRKNKKAYKQMNSHRDHVTCYHLLNKQT